jgi:AraC family transcriptional regulator
VDTDRYEARINRAIALIDRQIGQDLSLERLADEACLSPFHFHRIFSALTGESVHAMTTRMRMQQALALTRRGQRPQWKAVGAAVGYRSPDVFSRAFKRHFGCTPSQFDLEQWWHARPDRDRVLGVSSYFLRPAPPLPPDVRVEICVRPSAHLVVSRATGGYLDPALLVAAYERMVEASCLLGIALPGQLSGASQDDPELVPLSRCRYDFALEVPAGTRAPKGLHAAHRAEGRWAMLHVAGDLQAVDRAWNLLFKRWLPGSGLDLRAAPAEEIYRQTPNEIGWDRFDLSLAIPVED